MISIFVILSLYLSTLPLVASLLEPEVDSLDSMMASTLQGIVLLGEQEQILAPGELKNREGIHVYGVDLPGSTSKLRSNLTQKYLNKAWSTKTISQIKQEIYRYYQENQHPFVMILIPHQSYSSNVLQLVIKESKLGTVEIVGNKYTSSKRIKQYFSTQPGEPISIRRLSNDINFINRDPFRFVNVIYKPGSEANTTDLVLDVSDRKPYRFYTGFNNDGVLVTGRQRVFAGLSWDQVFGLDHILFYQYTTNYNGQRFHANTFQYLAFLPCKNILNFFGGFSVLHANISPPNRKNKGTNTQVSARYQVPLSPSRLFTHEISGGLDFKNTNNTMEFVDFSPVFGQTVNLTQFVLSYQAKKEQDLKLWEAGLDLVCSPAAWLPNQANADFESLRPHAKHTWVYGTAIFKLRRPLPRRFSYEMILRGQLSSQVLLPSEQLPLGGYGSVRGYDVRQFNADNGFFANFEIFTPKFPVIRRKKPHQDSLCFLLFVDGGYGMDKAPVPGIQSHEYLIGAGPGIRYHLSPYLTGRFDWGIKLHKQAVFTGGASMLYFSVIGSF